MVLWKQLSSHTAACFRALAEAGATVEVLHREATPDAPFSDCDLTAGLESSSWADRVDDARVEQALERFRPDVVLVCSWDVGPYRRAVRGWAGRALRVLCMDNSWLGTAKQWGGRAISPWVVRRSYDVAFLPGERQRAFANRLGFPDRALLWGLYACDERFFTDEPVAGEGFVTVGRLAPEKGIATLVEAYRRHRSSATDPWPLRVAGTGPLRDLLEDEEGVELLGFTHPRELPSVYQRSGCFVLASGFEPWGVVIQEAGAAGLPIVCTTACGASTRFVFDGYNGRVVEPDDPEGLATAMSWVADLSATRHRDLSRASRSLAAQLTPERWAGYVLERCHELWPGPVVRR